MALAARPRPGPDRLPGPAGARLRLKRCRAAAPFAGPGDSVTRNEPRRRARETQSEARTAGNPAAGKPGASGPPEPPAPGRRLGPGAYGPSP